MKAKNLIPQAPTKSPQPQKNLSLTLAFKKKKTHKINPLLKIFYNQTHYAKRIPKFSQTYILTTPKLKEKAKKNF